MTDQAAVEFLQSLMRIATVGRDEARVVAAIRQQLAPELAAGLVTAEELEFAPNRTTLVLTTGDQAAKRTLAFDGHADVVDAGDVTKWPYPPFAAEIHDGKLFGRGATDMKAGLAAATLAFQAAAHEPLTIRLQLFVTVGEEIDNYGARQLAAAGYADSLSALVVAEPTNGHLATAERGIIDYTVTATGKAAHSSTPEQGANAIHGLLAAFDAVLAATAPLQAREDPLLGHATHNVDLISGGNQINSIPESAHFRGNIRSTTAAPNTDFIAAIASAVNAVRVPGVTLTFTPDSVLGAVSASADSDLVAIVQAARAAGNRSALPIQAETGITDAALLHRPGQDLAIVGPGNATSHQTGEYVEVAEYLDFIALYRHIMTHFG